MAHTPGPWKNSGGYITAATGAEIASVEWAGSEPEGKANARLIAAAPQLLKFLREASVFVNNHTPFGGVAAKYRDLIEHVEEQ